MNQDKHIVILLYWSLKDPLCEGLMLDYLKRMNLRGYKFHLITFEQKKYKLSESEAIAVMADMRSKHIIWHPLEYKSGKFFIFKKIYSALQTLWLISKIKRKNNVTLLAAMASIAGVFAFLSSRILRIRYCQLTFEPHAEIVMGSGGLSEHSMKYKMFHRFEMFVGKKSEMVVCTSRHMKERLQQLGATGRIIRLPTCVNEHKNYFNEALRLKLRSELGFVSQRVLIYPGKFGGMYGKEDTIAFIAQFLAETLQHHALIITDYNQDELRSWFKKFNIRETQITLLGPRALDEIPGYICAADIGLIAYANFDARKYCSPVKTGEYLLCGLPYIVQQGTSEDDEVALKYNVGVVATSIDANGYDGVRSTLNELLTEDKGALRMRCREAGMHYRASSLAIETLRGIFTSH